MGLALISLIASYIYGRRRTTITRAAYVTGDTPEKIDEERLGGVSIFHPATKQKDYMLARA
jgi:hypothetical protein